MEIRERELKVQVKDPVEDVEMRSPSIIRQMELDWPEMTREFKKIQREQYELFLHKQHDYGPGNISVGQDLSKPDGQHVAKTGLVFRIHDKIQRLINLVIVKRSTDAANEPIIDAWKDSSLYCKIAQIVDNGSWGK